jgi:photosystem II stability/assembly factor-like uncharacterized protein
MAIYTSTDSGLTWSQKPTPNATNTVASLASSSDGQKLIAGVGWSTLDYIYTSVDSGNTWVARTGSTKGGWKKIACSSDATKIIAYKSSSTLAYISTNSGATWFTRNPYNAISVYIQSVAMSDDGQTLYILQGGKVYRSLNGGSTFIDVSPQSPIYIGSITTEISCNSDGTKIVVGGTLGRIYSSTDSGNSWTTITT